MHPPGTPDPAPSSLEDTSHRACARRSSRVPRAGAGEWSSRYRWRSSCGSLDYIGTSMVKTGSSLVLALDLGTGGCKGALYSRDGAAWRFASAAYKLHSAT